MPNVYPSKTPSFRWLYDPFNLYDVIFKQSIAVKVHQSVQLVERYTAFFYPWAEGYSTYMYNIDSYGFSSPCIFTLPATKTPQKVIVTWLGQEGRRDTHHVVDNEEAIGIVERLSSVSVWFKHFAIFKTTNEPREITLFHLPLNPITNDPEIDRADYLTKLAKVALYSVVITSPDDVVIEIEDRWLYSKIPFSPSPTLLPTLSGTYISSRRYIEGGPLSFSYFDEDGVNRQTPALNDDGTIAEGYNFTGYVPPQLTGVSFAVLADDFTEASYNLTVPATYYKAIYYAKQDAEPFKSLPPPSDLSEGTHNLIAGFIDTPLVTVEFPPSTGTSGRIGKQYGFGFQARYIDTQQSPPFLVIKTLDQIYAEMGIIPLTFHDLISKLLSYLDKPMANQDLMIQEIHACLGASEFAYSDNKADPPIPVYMHIARKVDYIAKALGVNFDLTGKIMSVRPSKHLNQGEVIPAGWSIGQFGRNEGASSGGQTGGLQDEERLGIVYEVKGNRFDTNQASGAEEIVDGGYILCESLTQYWHIMLQDLDRSLGLQTLGSYAIANPNYNPDYSGNNPEITTPYYTYNGLGDGLIELIYTLADTNRHALQANIGSLKSQAISQEVLGALGVPVLEKSLKVEVDSESATIKYPGFNGSAQTIADILFLGLMNLALQNER